MKNIIPFLGLLSTLILTAQTKNVYVEYGVQIQDEKGLSMKDSPLQSFFEYAMEKDETFLFGLIITPSGSYFFEKEQLALSDEIHMHKAALAFAGYTGVFYQFESHLYHENANFGRESLIKDELKQNWNLENETKMIDGYLCYKATNIQRVENRKGVFEHPVVAWFCPKLPYPYGPNGYSNLPGLILELQVRNVVFGVKKIDLESALDFDATFLKTVKTISQEQLNQKLEDRYLEMKSRVR